MFFNYHPTSIFNVSILNNYFQHPAYNDYPVIGVSYEQAIDYAKWRSDRVFEQVLLQKEVIDYNTTQNLDNYFSIEKYYNGEISGWKFSLTFISLLYPLI